MELPPNVYKINLPELKEFNYKKIDEELDEKKRNPKLNFQNTNPEDDEKEDEEVTHLRELLGQKLQKDHFYWNVREPRVPKNDPNYHYRFDLPASQFENEEDIQKVDLPEYTFKSKREKLNQLQLNEIWEQGQFKVKSEMENLPHVWRLSPWLVKSATQKTKQIRKVFAACLAALFAVVNIFDFKSSRITRLQKKKAILRANVFNIFVSLYSFVLNLVDLICGIRFRTIGTSYQSEINENLAKKEFVKLTRDEGKLNETCRLIEFLRYPVQSQFNLAVPAEKKKYDKKYNRVRKFQEQLNRVSSAFLTDFANNLQHELNKEDFEEEELKAIRESFESNKQDMLFEFLGRKKGEFEDPEIVNLLIKKMKIFVVMSEVQKKQDRDRKELEKAEEDKFRRQRPIYSLIPYKRKKYLKAVLKDKLEVLEAKHQYEMKEMLEKMEKEEELILALNYFQFKQREKKLFKAELREYKRHKLTPTQSIYYTLSLLPSQYIKKRHEVEGGSDYWTLTKTKRFYVHSNHFGYKLLHFVYSIGIYMFNINYFLIRSLWDGRLSLKTLFLWYDFYDDEMIDYYTGEFIRDKHTRIRPIFRKFTAILKGITIDKELFEKAPDSGFFGKGLSRWLLLFECYVIRLLLIGIGFVLIVLPILNVAMICMYVFLILTSIVWVLVFKLIRVTFRYLIYDYDMTIPAYSRHLRYRPDKNLFEYKRLSLVKSYGVFPLFRIFMDIFFQIVVQSVSILVYLFGSPLIALILFLYGIIVYSLKYLWDYLILNTIIKHFARVPSSNTSYAHRTSGPGINRDFYNSLSSEHISMLIIAQMERLELEQIRKEMTEILNTPTKHISTQTQKLLRNFSTSNSNVYIKMSSENLGYLLSSLQHCVNQRLKNLPVIKGGSHTIRFTKEDLNKNLLIAQSIIKEYIEEKDMDRYIWDRFMLRKGLFKRLSKSIFELAVSKTALEAVEQIDRVQSVHYGSSKISNYVRNVVNEESLNYAKKRVKQKKRIQAIRQQIKKTNSNFIQLNFVGNFYSNNVVNYNHPLSFSPIKQSQVDDWRPKEKNKK